MFIIIRIVLELMITQQQKCSNYWKKKMFSWWCPSYPRFWRSTQFYRFLPVRQKEASQLWKDWKHICEVKWDKTDCHHLHWCTWKGISSTVFYRKTWVNWLINLQEIRKETCTFSKNTSVLYFKAKIVITNIFFNLVGQ